MDRVDNMKEGELITSDQLRNEWANVLLTYDLFINGGHKLRPVRFIVRHIIDRGYDRVLYPGTSMYSLLISIPVNDKLNFNKTLKIEFDQLTENLKFTFKEKAKTQINWEETCQATEGCDLLERFLTENEEFRRLKKNKIYGK